MRHDVKAAGVDEVGRGPLAGPVVAAAVILSNEIDTTSITDSKKIPENRRQELALYIKDKSLSFAIGRAEVNEIDEINIHNATLLAMKRAVEQLSQKPDIVMVDGSFPPDIGIETQCIIKGDEKVSCISAASILAKVARDNEMIEMDRLYPEYGFAKHKGYPTKQHLEAIKKSRNLQNT